MESESAWAGTIDELHPAITAAAGRLDVHFAVDLARRLDQLQRATRAGGNLQSDTRSMPQGLELDPGNPFALPRAANVYRQRGDVTAYRKFYSSGYPPMRSVFHTR